ncbi:polysaccharide lyase 8 family protein [Vibrio sp. T20]|uniref:polysaccharide lyase 8 family protein n=1 Tax=Vibrio sp. T20 TaxID=2588450 RepID=UPI0011B4F2C7|nr:polysaccharide lyase 8 family protein [Vibrio sp. T20]
MKLNHITALIALLGCSGLQAAVPVAPVETPSVGVVSNQEVFTVMRDRWSGYFLGDQAKGFDAHLNGEVVKVNESAKRFLATLDITEQGLWPDLLLDDESSKGRRVLGKTLYETFNRLFVLARAYKLSGGELEGDQQLHSSLVESLSLLNEHFYNVGTAEWGNWWDWQLGISRVVNNTLVVMYDDLPSEIISNYVDATRYFVPRPTHLSEGYGAPYSTTPMMFTSTGGNRTDNAQVVLVRGILDKNEEEVRAAIDALSDIIPYVEEGDGFYRDGSFIQHKDLPYAGTYGQVMLEGLGMLLGVVATTPYEATDPNLQKIYPLLLASFAPMMVDGKMMDLVNGRAISRKNAQNLKVGQGVLGAMLLYLPGAPKEHKAQLASFIKSQIVGDDGELTFKGTSMFSSYQLAVDVASDESIVKQSSRVEHNQFPEMDRVVHHREGWSFGLAMHSSRVGNYECINNENRKGWHTADGMTYLFNDGSDHFNNSWPVIDSYKLPGTTALQDEREECSGQVAAAKNGRQGSMEWTGGVSIDSHGVAGMEFDSSAGGLSAKKSWFMFDDYIVALGSDVKHGSSTPALTTMENRMIAAGSEVKVNGQTLLMGSSIDEPLESLSIKYSEDRPAVSYASIDGQSVMVESMCREGDWSDIGAGNGKVEGCFVEATIGHDSGDVGEYSYVISPFGAPVAKSQLPFDVIKKDSSVHAVEYSELGLFAANFWGKGQAGSVTSKSPMSIMMKTVGDEVVVSVSDPTRSWWNTKFELEGQYTLISDSDGLVSLEQGNKFSVDLSDLAGSGYTFKLKRGSK